MTSGAPYPKDKPFVVDRVVLVCNGCQGERTFDLDPHFRSAKEVIAWLKTVPTPCPHCNSSTCDAKLRMVDPS